MNALGSLGINQLQLQGIVESDETFFRESLKGKRKITYRKAKKRGEKDEKRGISNLKIAVVVAQDRNGNIIATNYKKFARIKGLQHETINERQWIVNSKLDIFYEGICLY